MMDREQCDKCENQDNNSYGTYCMIDKMHFDSDTFKDDKCNFFESRYEPVNDTEQKGRKRKSR